MANAKVHLVIGLFGRAACGKHNVDTTRVADEVTCRTCQTTNVYAQRWAEQSGVVGPAR